MTPYPILICLLPIIMIISVWLVIPYYVSKTTNKKYLTCLMNLFIYTGIINSNMNQIEARLLFLADVDKEKYK